MHLCNVVQLSVENGGLGGKACYLSTEAFHSERLSSLSEAITNKFSEASERIDFGDGVLNKKIEDLSELLKLIQVDGALESLVKTSNIKLVVLDSLAALVRHEFGEENFQERAKILYYIANQFKRLASEYKLVVIITNQVSAFINNTSLFSNTKQVVPALGLTWSNFINMRVMLENTKVTYCEIQSKKRKEDESQITLKIPRRNMIIMLSSYLPNSSCQWVIEENEIHGINQD